MLREIKTAGLARRLSPLGWRYFVLDGSSAATATWGSGRHRRLLTRQREEPVALYREGERRVWLFEERFYRGDEGLGARDVLALIHERRRRRQRSLERAHAALAADVDPAGGVGAGPPRRPSIPRAVRLTVWERDGGRCVDCGSAFELQYDHVIPLSLGGASTAGNLQVLCAECNRRKGAGVA